MVWISLGHPRRAGPGGAHLKGCAATRRQCTRALEERERVRVVHLDKRSMYVSCRRRLLRAKCQYILNMCRVRLLGNCVWISRARKCTTLFFPRYSGYLAVSQDGRWLGLVCVWDAKRICTNKPSRTRMSHLLCPSRWSGHPTRLSASAS